jgi:hypothetical protein
MGSDLEQLFGVDDTVVERFQLGSQFRYVYLGFECIDWIGEQYE